MRNFSSRRRLPSNTSKRGDFKNESSTGWEQFAQAVNKKDIPVTTLDKPLFPPKQINLLTGEHLPVTAVVASFPGVPFWGSTLALKDVCADWGSQSGPLLLVGSSLERTTGQHVASSAEQKDLTPIWRVLRGNRERANQAVQVPRPTA